MIVFELYAGPGGGKSVAAAALYVALKNKGVRASLVGEAATELILSGTKQPCFDNQYYVGALQYERLIRLERAGCRVAVSDSPLIFSALYNKGFSIDYSEEQDALIRKLEKNFCTYKVFVHRVTPYDTYGRNQTAEDAVKLDLPTYDLGKPYWLEIEGNEAGQKALVSAALRTFAIQEEICHT